MTVGSGIGLDTNEQNPQVVNTAIQQLQQGRSNAVGTFTLSTGATTTTVTAPTVSPSTVVIPFQRTANAAAALATTFITSTSVTAGQFVVTHASTNTTDRTFGWIGLG